MVAVVLCVGFRWEGNRVAATHAFSPQPSVASQRLNIFGAHFPRRSEKSPGAEYSRNLRPHHSLDHRSSFVRSYLLASGISVHLSKLVCGNIRNIDACLAN